MHSHYNLETVKALVVVSAKEHGKVYILEHGKLNGLAYTEEHPPTYSDNEGFFTRSTGGQKLGSGNVREEADQHNLKKYIKAITVELRALVETHSPDVVFVIEPEYLKGQVKEHLIVNNATPVEEIAYGNYVEKDTKTIFDLVRNALSHEKDPTDPASVAGEKNAEEKRKLLEVGKQVSG